jgi:hypothetical protein
MTKDWIGLVLVLLSDLMPLLAVAQVHESG